MPASVAIGLVIHEFLFVIFSATSIGGFWGGPSADKMLGLGVTVSAMGFTLCAIGTGEKNKGATLA